MSLKTCLITSPEIVPGLLLLEEVVLGRAQVGLVVVEIVVDSVKVLQLLLVVL